MDCYGRQPILITRWVELTRRQQIWILKWQRETVQELLSGPSGNIITRLPSDISNALQDLSISTSPLDREQGEVTEEAFGLPPGALRPYGIIRIRPKAGVSSYAQQWKMLEPRRLPRLSKDMQKFG